MNGMFPQIGLGQTYNPFAQFQIMSDPVSALSSAGGGFFGGGLHAPELSSWGGGLGGMMQVAAIPGALDTMFTYRDPNQGWLGAGLSGAAQGATVGSMFGPWGTGIGAGLGYVGGKK